MKGADGTTDNWDFLASPALPAGEEALDFFHASQHLHAAILEAGPIVLVSSAWERKTNIMTMGWHTVMG